MADEDSKIVIPVEIDDSQARAQIEQLSETMQRTIERQSSRAGISPEEFYRRGEAIKEGVRRYQENQKSKTEEGGSKAAPNLEQEVFNETNKEVGRSAETVRLFREALHALHPAFSEAGISITEMTGFIRAATGGVVALGAAISGALITALEKAGDEANNASNRLGTFAPGGPNLRQGREELGGLRDLGRDVGEFPTELANPYEQLLRLNQNQPPGQQRPDSELREVLGTLVKGVQSERVDPEKGLSAITELLKSVRERGFVTGDSLKAFEDIAPRTAAAIVQELNKARPGAASYSDREFVGATRAAAGRINLNQQQSEADAPDSISDAWHHVKVASDRLSEVSQGGHLVAGALDKFADFIDLIGSAAKKIQERAPGLGSTLAGNIRSNLLPAPVESGLRAYNAYRSRSTTGTGQEQGRLNDAFDKTAPVASGAAGAAGASEELRSAFLDLNPAVKGAQGVLEDFAQKTKELSYVSADIAKKQAAINLAFEPAETASKLQKDQIGVESAGLRQRQVEQSRRDNEKQKELAELAPGEAHDRTNSAYTQYRQALAKFRGEGEYVDPYADLHSLQAARHGYQRAQLEEKYAGDEAPKAELAHEKLELDKRSADLERSDASLKLAKDSAGAPVSHELAQLRYAQASLDFDKVKVELLNKILAAIQKGDDKAKDDVKNLGESSSTRGSQDRRSDGWEDRSGDWGRSDRRSTLEDAYRDQQSGLHSVEEDARQRGQKPVYEGAGAGVGTPPPRGTDAQGPRPVRGHYDSNYNFVPDEPVDNGLGRGGSAGPGVSGASVPAQPQAPSPPQQQEGSAQVTQQVASLTSTLQELFSALSAKIAPPQPQVPDDSPVTGGVRGDAGGDSQASLDVAGLGDAASEARSSLSEFAAAVKSLSGLAATHASDSGDSGGTVTVATGGYVRGPGTTTSDSINARLSDKEYVQPADATEHYGVAFMDAIRTKSLPRFATGGLFSGMLSGMRSGTAASAPSHGGASSSASSAPGGAASQMQHWGTVDWRTDAGTYKVATQRDTMRHLSSAAKSAKRYSTGQKPGWYGGGNG